MIAGLGKARELPPRSSPNKANIRNGIEPRELGPNFKFTWIFFPRKSRDLSIILSIISHLTMTLRNGSPRNSGTPVKGKSQLQDDSIMGVGFLCDQYLRIQVSIIDSRRPITAALSRNGVLSVYTIPMNLISSAISSKNHRDDLL